MNEHYQFVNVPLPYAYHALEPYIDEKTMWLHHNKHLQTYIDNLNNILKKHTELQTLSLEELITKAVFYPPEIRTSIVNNAGGVYNHFFYFSIMRKPVTADGGVNRPTGILDNYLNDIFGGFDRFQEDFTKAALSVFGSGYAWLVTGYNGEMGIVTTPNQNTPGLQKCIPLLNIDVWEHAYYLKHYNVRADYIRDWFQVVNWEQVNRNFLNSMERNRFYSPSNEQCGCCGGFD